MELFYIQLQKKKNRRGARKTDLKGEGCDTHTQNSNKQKRGKGDGNIQYKGYNVHGKEKQ